MYENFVDMEEHCADIRYGHGRADMGRTWLNMGEHCVDMRGRGADMGRALVDKART